MRRRKRSRKKMSHLRSKGRLRAARARPRGRAKRKTAVKMRSSRLLRAVAEVVERKTMRGQKMDSMLMVSNRKGVPKQAVRRLLSCKCLKV
jgi:hypothetical protein